MNKNLEIQYVTLIEINSMEDFGPNAGKGEHIDYLLVNNEIREEFDKDLDIRAAILLMLWPNGRILYFDE